MINTMQDTDFERLVAEFNEELETEEQHHESHSDIVEDDEE